MHIREAYLKEKETIALRLLFADLPAEIRKARKELVMEQDELAEYLGMKKDLLNRIEKEKTEPDIDFVRVFSSSVAMLHIIRELYLQPEVREIPPAYRLAAIFGTTPSGVSKALEHITKIPGK
jgi:DNA-binding XRE family transcriptional regulator